MRDVIRTYCLAQRFCTANIRHVITAIYASIHRRYFAPKFTKTLHQHIRIQRVEAPSRNKHKKRTTCGILSYTRGNGIVGRLSRRLSIILPLLPPSLPPSPQMRGASTDEPTNQRAKRAGCVWRRERASAYRVAGRSCVFFSYCYCICEYVCCRRMLFACARALVLVC